MFSLIDEGTLFSGFPSIKEKPEKISEHGQ